MTDPRPLVIHVVFSFDVGGLENGIVNLLNHMPAEHFRHKIVALTRCVPSFCERVRRSDVEFVSLHKPAGHGLKLYPALFRMFREEKPAIVHTRNLAALEMVVPAWIEPGEGRLPAQQASASINEVLPDPAFDTTATFLMDSVRGTCIMTSSGSRRPLWAWLEKDLWATPSFRDPSQFITG